MSLSLSFPSPLTYGIFGIQGNFYIAFIILSDSMEDPSFKLVPAIHIVNVILEYFYLGLLVMCFILSLGNRPQGSKLAFTVAIIGFALITVYMTVAAFLLAFKGIEAIAAEKGGKLNISDAFTNSIFRNIVLSLLATLGLYVIASVIFVSSSCFSNVNFVDNMTFSVRPMAYDNIIYSIPSHGAVVHFSTQRLRRTYYFWHILDDSLMTSRQFSNVHDVSWGTKGDNKVSTDLGVVTTGKNKNEVEVMVPTTENDIDAAYEDAIHVLSTKPPKADSKPDPATQQEDYYRSFRTNVLLAWVLTNVSVYSIINSAAEFRIRL